MRETFAASASRRLALLALALTIGVLLIAAAQAGAYVYWGNIVNNTIGRTDLDGSGANSTFITGATDPNGMAVDGQDVYWTDFSGGDIGHANLDGSGANQAFITGATEPVQVAVDGQHIYWSNDSGNSIGRANLDGSNVNESFITGTDDPAGLVVEGNYIYWGNLGNGTIGRANLDGSGANEAFITTTDFITGMAADGQYLYWVNAEGANIGRANLDGTGVNENFITGATGPYQVAVDGQHVYWTNLGGPGNTVGRANLDGSGVNQSFITDSGQVAALAVDSGPGGTASPSNASMSFGTQPLATYGSPQTLTVTNTGHGDLTITGVQVSSGDVDDFLISYDTCTGNTLPIGGTCVIHVRFGPTSTGSRSATLTVSSNDPNSPLSISLSGTGGALPTGATGATGPQGPPGPAGKVRLVTCKTVTKTVKRHGKKHKVTVKKCTTKVISGSVTFTAAVAHATLERGRVIYATGTMSAAGLVLHARRSVPGGRYTLVLRQRSGRRLTTRRLAIRIT